MTITLTPKQQERLEAAVAAGHFPSVEAAVQYAVDNLLLTTADLDDLSWARPLLDEARASLARGEGLSLEEFNAHVEKRLQDLR